MNRLFSKKSLEMKNLRKIIALFIFIFVTGIIVTVVSINSILNDKTPIEAIKPKDSINYLIKIKKSI